MAAISNDVAANDLRLDRGWKTAAKVAVFTSLACWVMFFLRHRVAAFHAIETELMACALVFSLGSVFYCVPAKREAQ